MANTTQTTVTEDDGPKALTELSHRGFSALILIDGVPTPIYRPEYDTHTGQLLGKQPLSEKRIMAGWIASEAGKSFSVAFANDEGEDSEHASCGHILVDGKDVASAILRPGRRTPVTRHGAKVSPTVVKPFTFGKLELTDDDDVADPNDPRAAHIGTIRVEIKFIQTGKIVPLLPVDAKDVGVIHEKAKKAGIHTTTYQSTERVAKGRSVSTKPLYPDDEWTHHIVFIFRYRSKDILMAEGIMPRPEVVEEDTAIEEEVERVLERNGKRQLEEDDDEEIDDRKRAKSAHASSEDDGGLLESPMDQSSPS